MMSLLILLKNLQLLKKDHLHLLIFWQFLIIQKNPTSDDFHQSLNLFEEAYLKEKNTINGLNAIKNLIITGIKICRVSKEFINIY